MHPATLGAVDRRAAHDGALHRRRRDSRDKRARQVAITDKGRELIESRPDRRSGAAPGHGPRYRKLDRLKAAFEDAVEMFGLTDHLPGKTEGR